MPPIGFLICTTCFWPTSAGTGMQRCLCEKYQPYPELIVRVGITCVTCVQPLLQVGRGGIRGMRVKCAVSSIVS